MSVLPFVCCTYTNCFGTLSDSDYSSVSVDDYQTAYRAVKTLIELGHRRIAVVLPDCADRSISELRYKGYRAALRDSGIPFDADLLVETDGCFEMPETYTRQRRNTSQMQVSLCLPTVSRISSICALYTLSRFTTTTTVTL